MKLFEKAEPGESVQVDVKFVKIAGRWAFQYTALDDCTRFRVLRLYRRLHQSSSLLFLAELCRAFPFRIRKLQCDHAGVSLCLRAGGAGIGDSSSLHPAAPAPAERQGGTQSSNRPGRILGPPPIRRLRCRGRRPARLGSHVQLPTLLLGASGANAGRKVSRAYPRSSRVTPCLNLLCTAGQRSILTRPNSLSACSLAPAGAFA